MIYRNLLLFLHFSLLALPGSEKIDAAIDLNKRDFSPVFVRMSNQLVTCAGEYEKQIIVRTDKIRSKNRKEVIGLLQQKAKDSWEALNGTLRRLSKEGEIRNIRKFWVVNGFTCLARASAIRKLANQPEVSLIYLDRFAQPVRQSSSMPASQFQDMRKILAEWRRKDSLPSKNVSIPWNVREIGANLAWKEVNATGRGVKVAVIDTGIVPAPALIHALAKNPGKN
jgi:bacillopeptidase F